MQNNDWSGASRNTRHQKKMEQLNAGPEGGAGMMRVAAGNLGVTGTTAVGVQSKPSHSPGSEALKNFSQVH